jgi:hypothetical protein
MIAVSRGFNRVGEEEKTLQGMLRRKIKDRKYALVKRSFFAKTQQQQVVSGYTFTIVPGVKPARV